ncbi:tail fiber assembly protein [Klebsiella pneumoniae]|uniref:tail fiber assembly protein n=1 Tax=Klebsiella pneumoniae TaxID=573 RepID=UPI002E178375|nr:tail fiber assembly protein [Klebsiella pneumoniae]
MMNAKFDFNGLCILPGDVIVYNYSPDTREYTSSTVENIPFGVSLPACSTLEPPPEKNEGYAVCRNSTGTAWEQVEDHRGKTLYRVSDQTQVVMSVPGEVPEGYTLQAPDSAYDVWNGSSWVTDNDKKNAALAATVAQQKASLLSRANNEIAWLQDAVDLNQATESETQHLSDWKTYRIALNRTDLTDPASVSWPSVPVGAE